MMMEEVMIQQRVHPPTPKIDVENLSKCFRYPSFTSFLLSFASLPSLPGTCSLGAGVLGRLRDVWCWRRRCVGVLLAAVLTRFLGGRVLGRVLFGVVFGVLLESLVTVRAHFGEIDGRLLGGCWFVVVASSYHDVVRIIMMLSNPVGRFCSSIKLWRVMVRGWCVILMLSATWCCWNHCDAALWGIGIKKLVRDQKTY